MKLEKAIEILTHIVDGELGLLLSDYKNAIKLGNEALKRIGNAREEGVEVGVFPLPSETEE